MVKLSMCIWVNEVVDVAQKWCYFCRLYIHDIILDSKYMYFAATRHTISLTFKFARINLVPVFRVGFNRSGDSTTITFNLPFF